MPRINTPKSGHVGPAPGLYKYLPYTDAHYLAILQHAINAIDGKIKGHPPCDKAFSSLPGGKTFSQLWMDPGIWINFDPSKTAFNYGATRDHTKEITLTAYTLSMGKWTVAATLVHEMAHVNGASGLTHAAEGTLAACMLKHLENPLIIGNILNASRRRKVA